jgi:response regulator of citrate/malate metabolism
MSANKPWTSQQAEHVLDEIAASIEAATPSEIEEDFHAANEDLDAIAGNMKSAVLEGIKQFQQRRLHQARQRYQESSRQIERRPRRVASSTDARRVQFFALLQANPGVQSALTIQHRDLNALTDQDIESALEELDALGAIDDLGETPNDVNS